MLHDDPNLTEPNDKYQSQIFETAALAIAGNQKGVFYGSVNGAGTCRLVTQTRTCSSSISSRRMRRVGSSGEAARLWNASKTTQNQPSIAVPSMSMYRIAAPTELWEGIGAEKSSALSRTPVSA